VKTREIRGALDAFDAKKGAGERGAPAHRRGSMRAGSEARRTIDVAFFHVGAQFLVALVCRLVRRRCESSTCRRSRRSSARARRLRAPSSPSPARPAPRRRAPHRRTRLHLIRPAQLCDVSIDVRGAVYFVLARI